MDEKDLILGNGSLSAIIESGQYYSSNNAYYDQPQRLRSATEAATYEKFTGLVGKIIDLTNESRERPITFIPFNSYDKSHDIVTPLVTYKVSRRIPFEQRPRQREIVNDKDNNDNAITIMGQKFVYSIMFSIYDGTYKDAENTMREIEDILLSYTGYFLEQGVSDIRFSEQMSDENINMREDFFVKSLVYNVTLEKITLVSEAKIKKIISNISTD